jgi:iron complex outermembrane receptor protein
VSRRTWTCGRFDWLNFGASLVYTDARFTKNKVDGAGQSAAGLRSLCGCTQWSGTVFAEVSHEVGSDDGTLSLRGDFYFQSMSYFGNLSQLIPGTGLPAYQLIGARLGWSNIMGGPVSAAVYGRNLTNEKYYTGGNPTGLSAGFNTAFPRFPEDLRHRSKGRILRGPC